jgi:SAM-dependent methyltransferase
MIPTMSLRRSLRQEVAETLRNPRRLRNLLNPSRVRSYIGYLILSARLPEDWRREGGIRRRAYRSYAEYLGHQAQKLGTLDLTDYDRTYAITLGQRIADLDLKGRAVLCLGARLGTEVRAFRERGAFAVGIDLNPGKRNEYVTYGDFHRVAYADDSANVVFTNSLDHAYDVDVVLSEVRRLLPPGGLFVVEAIRGDEEGVQPQFYESFFWSTIDDLVGKIERCGFRLDSRAIFDAPWVGEHLRFEPLTVDPGASDH